MEKAMRKRMRLRRHAGIAAALAAMCCATVATAAEYFVSTGGCDRADGSAPSPWRTIQRAADAAVAGDTVTIRGGIYREWVKPPRAGREGAPIVFRAAKGEKVVVTGADPVNGWTRRADGLWTARISYDSFGGLNPFTDFISGDWFDAKGRKHFRTRLIQDGKPLVLHGREVLAAGNRSPADVRRCLVNVAGISCGGRTTAGGFASDRKGPPGGLIPKTGFKTKWGMELGWIQPGAECVFKGLDLSAPGARELSLHFSCAANKTAVDVCDAAAPDKPLATLFPPVTGSWTEYATASVRLPDSAAGVKDVMLRFREAEPRFSPPIAPGHAAMVPGRVAGTIVAAFAADPNVHVPELVVRPACFYPVLEHRDFITLRGISFENAGPDWAPPTSEQTGVVGVNWSCGWTIEDCEVSGSSCAGITLGKYGDEFDNAGPTAGNYHNTIRRAAANGLDRVGRHAVRRCRITDCGQAGICGSLGAAFSTVEDCEISYCFWEKPFGGAEMGGIKIHGAVDFTVSGCRIHHSGYSGVWFDWMAQGARVANCRMWANNHDLWFEVNHGPILVEDCFLLSDVALQACSQGAAFVGNRMKGKYRYHNDARRTPVFKPHSVELVSVDEVACGQGGFVFINNVIGNDPRFAKEAYKSRYEDNWMIPARFWKVDDATGECEISPPAGSFAPCARPVDANASGRLRSRDRPLSKALNGCDNRCA